MLIWICKANSECWSRKYKYNGYGIGFDFRSEFLSTDGSFGKNVIIFGADMSSSVYIDSKGKDILILGDGPSHGWDDTTLKVEAKFESFHQRIY